MTSTTSTHSSALVTTTDYKRPTFFLLLITLTLYPSPSPLFHMICLPLMILLHRHDGKLFGVYIPAWSGVVTFIAKIWEGGKEGWVGGFIQAGEYSSVVIATVVGSVTGHHRLMTLNGTKQKTAWSDSLLFGLIWTSFGITNRTLGYNHAILTPSSARYESLRIIHRNLDLLSASSPEDKKLWEWIKMQPIDKDAIAIPTNWNLAEPAVVPESGQSHHTPGDNTEWTMATDQDTSASPTSEHQGDITTCQQPLRLISISSRSTHDAERSALSIESAPYRGYGTISQPNNLIDLESARSANLTRSIQNAPDPFPPRGHGTVAPHNNVIDLESARTVNTYFSFPTARRSGLYRMPLPPVSEEAGSTIDSSTETAETAPTTVTSTSDSSNASTLLRYLLAFHQTHPRHLKRTVIAIMALWSFIFTPSLPSHLSLSAPLIGHTPLAVACIIPPVEASVADMIYLSQTVSGRVKLIVWPEDSVIVIDEMERDLVMEDVRLAIGVQYGVWTLMSVVVEETGRRERVLIGAEGRVDAGSSFSEESEQVGTDWTVLLPPPNGVTRFNWTQAFPHFRPIHFAATTPGDQSGHFSIPMTDIPPSLLIIPAQSISEAQSALQLTRTQELAIKHGTPAILCTSSTSGKGSSAVIDPAGRILFQQSGGQSWTLSLALWFREGETRSWTGYEDCYGAWLFGTVLLISSIHMSMNVIAKRTRNPSSAQSQTQALSGVSVSGLSSWSSRKW